MDALQAGIKTVRRNINNLRYADDTTLIAEREEELKNLLMSVKEENERSGLKLNIKTNKQTNKDCDIQPPYFMADRGRKGGSSDRFPLLGL